MNKQLKKAIEISKALQPEYKTGQHFHTSIAMIRNRIVSIGLNNYNQSHFYYLFGIYQNFKNYPTEYQPSHHSECDMIKKLLKLNCDINKVKVYNVRIDNNGIANIAAPCENCMGVLKNFGFKKIYYTVNERDYGTLIFDEKSS